VNNKVVVLFIVVVIAIAIFATAYYYYESIKLREKKLESDIERKQINEDIEFIKEALENLSNAFPETNLPS